MSAELELLEGDVDRVAACAHERMACAEATWRAELGIMKDALGQKRSDEDLDVLLKLHEAELSWKHEAELQFKAQVEVAEAQRAELLDDLTRCKAHASMLEETIQQQQHVSMLLRCQCYALLHLSPQCRP